MPPTLANGKICYIEMPAVDVARSADFYSRVFGWSIRTRGDGTSSVTLKGTGRQEIDDTAHDVCGPVRRSGSTIRDQRHAGCWYRPMMLPPGSLNRAVISGASAPIA